MKKMMNRINKKEGFTLAELLIVVAIIAVLVAVSIPVFTSRLEKAREATDLANLRAAYAAGVAEYMGNTETYATTAGSFLYNAGKGSLDTTGDKCLKGQAGTGADSSIAIGGFDYHINTAYAGKDIVVSIGTDGTVSLSAQ